VEGAIAQQAQAKVQANVALAQRKAELCLQAESAWFAGNSQLTNELQAQWDASEKLSKEWEAALAARFQRAIVGAQSGQAPAAELLLSNAERAQALAMTLEYLNGRESPAELKAERMQFQVQRLSLKMQSGSPESSAQESARLRNEWLALGPLANDLRAALTSRIHEFV
jgi:hypothetical protein